MYDSFVRWYFWWCVELLRDISGWMGITYEELNVWVFVVMHPLVTLFLFVWVVRLRRKVRSL